MLILKQSIVDSGIIISLVLGCASAFSSICFGLVPSIRKNRIDKLEIQKCRLFRDIHLFYDIEEELLEYIKNNLPNVNKSSLKIKIRETVSERNNGDVLSDYSKPSVYKKHIK